MMKKLILTLSIVLLAASGWAQNKALDKLFDKYSGEDGFTSIVITKYMFNLFSNVETTEDDEYMNMIKNLKDIKILSGPGTANSEINFYQEALDAMPEKEFEEVMSITEKGKNIKFLVKEEKEKIIALVMLIGGKEESALICITGIIDMNTIAKLSKSMNIEGMEDLDNLEKKFPR